MASRARRREAAAVSRPYADPQAGATPRIWGPARGLDHRIPQFIPRFGGPRPARRDTRESRRPRRRAARRPRPAMLGRVDLLLPLAVLATASIGLALLVEPFAGWYFHGAWGC